MGTRLGTMVKVHGTELISAIQASCPEPEMLLLTGGLGGSCHKCLSADTVNLYPTHTKHLGDKGSQGSVWKFDPKEQGPFL